MRVSYAMTTFSGPKSIKLWVTENEVKEFTHKLLRAHEFWVCMEIRDDSNVEIAELNGHYSYYINRKVYFPVNVQVVCN